VRNREHIKFLRDRYHAEGVELRLHRTRLSEWKAMELDAGGHDWGAWQPLLTDRLILRGLSPNDAPAVSELLSDDRVTATMLWDLPVPYPVEAGYEWIEATGRQMTLGQVATWAITMSDSPAGMIGAVSLHPNWPLQRAGLGYWLGVPHWRQAIMTEATRRAIRFAFDDLHLHRVHAECFASNRASWRVLEKAGLTLEGQLKEHRVKRGRFEDELIYGMVNESQQQVDPVAPRAADALLPILR
jgi:RimJ/RimL family protein N-acetyltransferase